MKALTEGRKKRTRSSKAIVARWLQRCADCVYFKATTEYVGICRRYPPTLGLMAAPFNLPPNYARVHPSGVVEVVNSHPSVRPDGWCGEFSARDR